MKNVVKKSISFLVVCCFLSCNLENKETQKEIEEYKTEIASLKKKIQIKESVNFSMKEINEKNEAKLKNLEEKAKSQFYLSKNDASFLLDEKMQFILNKKDFFDKAIELADFKNNSFYRIYFDFFNFSDFFEEFPVKGQKDFVWYLMNRFDRSSKNIRSFFNEEIVEYVAEAIKLTGAYESSGLERRIDFLIATYEDDQVSSDFFLELYTKFDSREWGWDEDFLLNLPSENIKMIMSEPDGEGIVIQDVFDSYGFWARRYHEHNAEVVYTILKEFKTFLP